MNTQGEQLHAYAHIYSHTVGTENLHFVLRPAYMRNFVSLFAAPLTPKQKTTLSLCPRTPYCTHQTAAGPRL